MSVFSRFLRRLALFSALLALLGSLSGCAEVKSKLHEGGEFLRDLFMNSIDRFPESSANAFQQPQDTTLPPEFVISAPAESLVVGTVSEDVNIRSGPNADYDHLGSFRTGTQLKIYHQLLIGNSPWGLTESGWVSMNYVVLDDPKQAISIAQAESKNCLIVIPDLDVRSGPGWQYPSTGLKMEGYTTHPVLAQSGPWIQVAQGWISKDGVYVERSEPARTGTVTGSEVNVRTGPGTQYKVTDVVVRNDTLTVFHQVEVNGKYWGYTSIGWISMTYVKLEDPDDGLAGQPETTQIVLRDGIQDGAIVGEWQDATLTANGTSLIFGGKWLFNEDGAFSYIGKDFHYSNGMNASANAADAEKAPEFHGMYTYDGSVLTLFCTEDSSLTESELPYIRLLSAKIENGVMTLTSGDASTQLYHGAQDAVASQLLSN